MAENYDAVAVYNDGTCEYVTASECTDDLACNYDTEATLDDGSCGYAEEFFDCGSSCLADVDCNGTWGRRHGGCPGYLWGRLVRTRTPMACAMTWTNASASTTPWACNGGCALDEDADGICDDVDECVGALDECG